jgi:hypothetical protein
MSKPRILIYDIETTPVLGWAWQKWQTNLLGIVEDSHLLSVAYKWHGEGDDVTVLSQPQFQRDYRRNRKDDRKLTKKIHKLFNEADVTVAHYGDKFDFKKVQGRFLQHGFGPASQTFQVDTKKIASKHFKLTSNSLNDLGQLLDLGMKLPHTGFQLWLDCMAGDPEAWQLMVDYNAQDVVLLEKVYDRFLYEGWIDNHPNLANITGNLHNCPKCHATEDHMHKRGNVRTKTLVYQQWQCNVCHSYSRQRKSGTGPKFQ